MFLFMGWNFICNIIFCVLTAQGIVIENYRKLSKIMEICIKPTTLFNYVSKKKHTQNKYTFPSHLRKMAQIKRINKSM